MDLRSIVNAEDIPDLRKLPGGKSESPVIGNVRPPSVPHLERGKSGIYHDNRGPSGPENHEGRPSFPPPIRPVAYNDPYPLSASPTAMGKQIPHPVVRPSVDGHGPHLYQERGSASSSQGHHSFSTPLTRTPTGSSPGSAGVYSSFQRPTSSHSATPGSIPYPPASLLQRSPQPANTHARYPSQPQISQQYPSQPHTPLGPPSGRPLHNNTQDSPGIYGHQRSYSNGSFGQQQPGDSLLNVSKSPIAHSSRPSQAEHTLSADLRAREQSPSVSPKTRIDALPMNQVPGMGRPHSQATIDQTDSPKNTANTSTEHANMNGPDMKPLPRRTTSSFAIGGLLNEAPAVDETVQRAVTHASHPLNNEKDDSRKVASSTHVQSHQPPLPSEDPMPLNSNHRHLTSTPTSEQKPVANSVPTHSPVPMEGILSNSHPAVIEVEVPDKGIDPANANQHLQVDTDTASPLSKSQHPRKKPRLEAKSKPQDLSPATPKSKLKRSRQVPIFAQSVRQVPLTVNGGLKSSGHGPQPRMLPATPDKAVTAVPAAHVSVPSTSTQEANGNAQTNGTYVPVAQPERDIGPLGPWEPSILDIHPTEDMTKVISDWLFAEVVQKQGIGVGPAGGSANKGAVLEIEAKIGRLIDQNTNDRLRLPVISECVISQSDPNMRVNFESSMTEPQHRAMNGFLNKAVQDSLQKVAPATTPSAKKRIPIRYHHTYETDRFYELSQQGLLGLPLAITDYVEARNKRKTTVRITSDQKTGKELAKIVKARLADINVYSPRTLFDYRISVNVEMNFDGNMGDLVEPGQQRGRKPDRNKDRMSYNHLAYQIDLTQVTPTEGANKAEKEHELEIELSSEEVRRQGLLAMKGQDHEYDKLVKGFLDNVRVLARHCQPPLH